MPGGVSRRALNPESRIPDPESRKNYQRYRMAISPCCRGCAVGIWPNVDAVALVVWLLPMPPRLSAPNRLNTWPTTSIFLELPRLNPFVRRRSTRLSVFVSICDAEIGGKAGVL